jgi:hypothetical protein
VTSLGAVSAAPVLSAAESAAKPGSPSVGVGIEAAAVFACGREPEERGHHGDLEEAGNPSEIGSSPPAEGVNRRALGLAPCCTDHSRPLE